MRRFALPFVLAAVIMIGTLPSAAHADQTEITESDISTDTTWTKDSSPYVITNDLAVDKGATLTIEPGVVVKFANGVIENPDAQYPSSNPIFLNVSGSLDVQGTPDDKVVFTSLQNDSIGGDTNGDGDATQPNLNDNWGIYFASEDSPSTMENFSFRYSGSGIQTESPQLLTFRNFSIADGSMGISSYGGNLDIGGYSASGLLYSAVDAYEGTVKVSSATISDLIASFAAIAAYGSAADIRNVDISRMQQGGMGLYFYFSDANVDNVTVEDTSRYGAYFSDLNATVHNLHVRRSSGSGIYLDNASVNISGSSAEKPGNYSSCIESYSSDAIVSDFFCADATSQYGIGMFQSNFDFDKLSMTNTGAFNPLGAIFIYGSSGTVSDSLLDGGLAGGIAIYSDPRGDLDAVPNVTIASSTIRNFPGDGILVVGTTTAAITGNILTKNGGGIEYADTEFSDGSLISGNSVSGNTLGLANDHVEYGWDDAEQKQMITRVPLDTPVIAAGNWWGDASGPDDPANNPDGKGDTILGAATTTPWLTEDPFAPKKKCCSSVAFLPGIEGSRLFIPPSPGLTAPRELWEPLLSSDVSQLFLDSDGKTINPNVAVGGVIGQAVLPVLGPKIYQSFVDEMNGMVEDKTIAGWKPFAYDWRLDWNSIVDDGTKQQGGSVENMVAEIEKLAGASKTGKVTLVAHSMGGLVAKVVIDRLEKKGEAGLIDKLLDVAVPELGTPAAIGSILHGSGGGIGEFGINFLLSDATARGLAANAPGAYGLLPSAEYFRRVADPVVEFDLSTAPISNLFASYGSEIASSTVLTDFLTAGTDHRTAPDANDLVSPLVANAGLLAKAAALHSQLDTMAIPANIQVTQIAGWGLSTVRGVKYVAKTEQKCGTSKAGLYACSPESVLDNQPIFVEDGDGTVVTPSATAVATSSYYLDIKKSNRYQGTSLDHKDIFEAQPILDFVKNIIIGSSTIPAFLSEVKPAASSEDKTIHLSVHSPATIDIYDDQGRHTGPIPNPNPDSDLQLYEANIPNSYYLPFGEGKYAGYDASASTTVKIHGTGGGTFTLDVQQTVADIPDTQYVYKDIPVSTSTEASFSISSGTSTPIVVDENGDGKEVFSVRPQADDGSDVPNPDIPVEATSTPGTIATSTPAVAVANTVAAAGSVSSGGGQGSSMVLSAVSTASNAVASIVHRDPPTSGGPRSNLSESSVLVVPGLTRDPGLHLASSVIPGLTRNPSASSAPIVFASSDNPERGNPDPQPAAIEEAARNKNISNILFISAVSVTLLGALFLGRRFIKS